MRILIALGAGLLATGCVATYAPPTSESDVGPRSFELQASKKQAWPVLLRTLAMDGFSISSADEASGTLTTALRAQRIGPESVNCGTTMGLDYLKDKRTETRVGYGVVLNDGSVAIRAVVEAQYKPGSVSQDIVLTCYSTGALERALHARLVAGTASN